MSAIPNDLLIQEVSNDADLTAIRQLFWNYGLSRGFDDAMGDFKTEIEQLPGPYARPCGCLLIAYYQKIPVGCVAYQQLELDICEMKRLYVEPDYRGHGFGQNLVAQIIEEAKKTTYSLMRLDTFAYYEAAIYQYKRAGFYEIPPYQKYSVSDVLFFEKQLTDVS